jgi:hypothetical protein
MAAPPTGPVAPAVQLTLLSRAYCHLCEEMRTAALPLAAAHGAALVVLDVDADPELEAAHGDRVPVLFLGAPGNGVELCHFHLDVPGVRAALAAAAQSRAEPPESC